MATVIQQPSNLEEVKIDSVITLLGEFAERLSIQSRSAIQPLIIFRVTLLATLLGLIFLSALFAYITILVGTESHSQTLFGMAFVKVFWFPLAFLVTFICLAWFVSSKFYEFFPAGFFHHALLETSRTYELSRKVLAQASAIHEYYHLEDYQRLMLEVRSGALDAAVAYYEAVIQPLVKKHVPDGTVVAKS